MFLAFSSESPSYTVHRLMVQVRNPDGTTTTRTASGARTTRPGLGRNASSNPRLAAAVASAKLQPLTRSTTTEDVAIQTVAGSLKIPFTSSIYCSQSCAEADHARHGDSYPASSYGSGGISPQLHINTSVRADPTKSPYAPPSPLTMSDTGSSASTNPAAPPASSAPQAIDYFRIGRDDPERAWRETNEALGRTRRSSMHPAIRPTEMVRWQSQYSHYSRESAYADMSSDSLSSLWQEDHIARSNSNPGKLRAMAAGDARRMSTHSERGIRPLRRSNLSQASLIASPPTSPLSRPIDAPAPSPAMQILQQYANSFSSRSPASAASPSRTWSAVFRRPSQGAPLSRPLSETVRPPPPPRAQSVINGFAVGEITWDSFGAEQIMARRVSQAAVAANRPTLGASLSTGETATPRQRVELEDGHWRLAIRRGNSEGPSGSVLRKPSRPTFTPTCEAMPPPPLPTESLQRLSISSTSREAPSLQRTVWKGLDWKDPTLYELPKGLRADTSKGLRVDNAKGLFFVA